MRKRAKPHPETDREVLCPFCGASAEVTSKVPWCTGCGAARSVGEDGEVIFDASRKADRETLAAAVRAEGSRAGGLSGAPAAGAAAEEAVGPWIRRGVRRRELGRPLIRASPLGAQQPAPEPRPRRKSPLLLPRVDQQ